MNKMWPLLTASSLSRGKRQKCTWGLITRSSQNNINTLQSKHRSLVLEMTQAKYIIFPIRRNLSLENTVRPGLKILINQLSSQQEQVPSVSRHQRLWPWMMNTSITISFLNSSAFPQRKVPCVRLWHVLTQAWFGEVRVGAYKFWVSSRIHRKEKPETNFPTYQQQECWGYVLLGGLCGWLPVGTTTAL